MNSVLHCIDKIGISTLFIVCSKDLTYQIVITLFFKFNNMY